MAKQEKNVHKKGRGRPPGTQYRETIPVRLTPESTAAIDKWAEQQAVSRSEAIRRLVDLGLKAKAR